MSRYYEYDAQPTFSERMTGTIEISEAQSSLIKKSYLFLGISVAAACGGAYVGAETPVAYNLFYNGWFGWVLAMIVLNLAPRIAMACRHNPVLGMAALIGDGFISGLVMGPVVAVAAAMSPATGDNIVVTACLVTFAIFAGVTVFVMFTGTRFRAPAGVMTGLFIGIIVAIGCSFFFGGNMIYMLINVAIGVFGVIILINSTSTLLYDRGIDSPIAGALMLFAGIFNVFVAVLYILMSLSGRD